MGQKIVYFIPLLISLFIISCATVDKNVLVYKHDEGYAPCEPSIAIDPSNPKNIVAGSVLSYVHTSSDAGKTWNTNLLKSSLGVYGDPAITVSPSGTFYYAHLGDPEHKGWQSQRLLESIIVQRSDDAGKSWNDGKAVGTNPPKDQDKEWITVSPDERAVYMSWTEFDLYDSKSPKDHTRILFSSSMDKGKTWSKPKTLSKNLGNCLDDDNTVEGAVPAAGRKGRVYVAWAGHENIYFNRSSDYGKSWLTEEKTVALQPGGWSQPIEGMKRVNGMPVTAVDNSGGPHDGRIYILWADQRAGKNNLNIFIIHSDDEGENWTLPQRINNDDHKAHQFFPWLTLDQTTGYVYAVYYNRANNSKLKNDVSLARSYDGGVSWHEKVISEKSFDTPPELIFFGDYNNISAADGNIRPIWTRYDEGYLSIWTALIKEKNMPKRKRP